MAVLCLGRQRCVHFTGCPAASLIRLLATVFCSCFVFDLTFWRETVSFHTISGLLKISTSHWLILFILFLSNRSCSWPEWPAAGPPALSVFPSQAEQGQHQRVVQWECSNPWEACHSKSMGRGLCFNMIHQKYLGHTVSQCVAPLHSLEPLFPWSFSFLLSFNLTDLYVRET